MLVIAIIAIPVIWVPVGIRVPVVIGPAACCRRKGKRSQANGAAYDRRGRVPTIIPVVAPAVVVPMAIPTIVPMVMPIIVDRLDLYWWRSLLSAICTSAAATAF